MPSVAASSLVQLVITVYFHKTLFPLFLLFQNYNANSSVNITERKETNKKKQAI